MSPRTALLVALVAAACLAPAVVRADDPWYLKLDVQLDDKTTGDIILRVEPDMAPLGAARLREIVDEGIWDNARFFRVINGFMAQFGIPGEPSVAAAWRDRKIQDDPVKGSNSRGWLSFATSGKNSRTTQVFINFGNNGNLDSMGFSPLAEVVKGMDDVVEKIHKIGEGAPRGPGPAQGRIQSEGNAYLESEFPQLSYIRKASIVADAEGAEL